jgi:aminoglycoside phosphotransferase (APT) family kinase protein
MDPVEPLEARTAAAIVEAQFPELAPASVVYLGEGCDSTAFVVNQRWVFRFPKRDEVAQQLLLEWRILPALAADSPLPLPDFCFSGRPSSLFPRHFVGYRKIDGVPAIGVPRQRIPASSVMPLGTFLSWLHSQPVAMAERARVPHLDSQAVIDEYAAQAADDLDRVAQIRADWPIGTWRALVERPPASRVSVVLVHGDLAPEHVLYDQAADRITGVIDWGEIGIGDPALDVAAAVYWSDLRLFSATLITCPHALDEELLRRARFYAACRGVADIVYGFDTGRDAYVKAGVRALRFCVELAADLDRA